MFVFTFPFISVKCAHQAVYQFHRLLDYSCSYPIMWQLCCAFIHADTGQKLQLTSDWRKKKSDLSDFERGKIVKARWGELSVFLRSASPGIFHNNSLLTPVKKQKKKKKNLEGCNV